ncbi:hypothetical protein [Amycolatopsis tolypomycina]|uniref:Uncharacterized protein n=1 Tax=Amycolatopsis tolypomycina TaxID=208445 RepID=A0A1H5BGJ8_9PSEU|nr:hypothetical protein [Amycolatopsis tolypomycina]SED53164.1 hypothetical protein SAMN04489727_8251 [Amycolatopsis tolypomycina]
MASRADPRTLVAAGVIAALTGAATGVFWGAMSGAYDGACTPGNPFCSFGRAIVGAEILLATVAGTSLLTLFALSMTRLRPRRPVVLTALLAPLALAVVYHFTDALGAYRIALLAAVSAVLHVGVAWTARTAVR